MVEIFLFNNIKHERRNQIRLISCLIQVIRGQVIFGSGLFRVGLVRVRVGYGLDQWAVRPMLLIFVLGCVWVDISCRFFRSGQLFPGLRLILQCGTHDTTHLIFQQRGAHVVFLLGLSIFRLEETLCFSSYLCVN